MAIAGILRRLVLVGLMALFTNVVQAQTPTNFDGVWRGVWTKDRTATFEFQISNSASGAPSVTQTRWSGTDTSGTGDTQMLNGTIEGDQLRYDILTPYKSAVVLTLKNENLIAATYVRGDLRLPGNTFSLDLARK